MKRYVKSSGGFGKFDLLPGYIGAPAWVRLCIKAPEAKYGSKKVWYKLVSDKGDYYIAWELDETTRQKKPVNLQKDDIKYIDNDCSDEWMP